MLGVCTSEDITKEECPTMTKNEVAYIERVGNPKGSLGKLEAHKHLMIIIM